MLAAHDGGGDADAERAAGERRLVIRIEKVAATVAYEALVVFYKSGTTARGAQGTLVAWRRRLVVVLAVLARAR